MLSKLAGTFEDFLTVAKAQSQRSSDSKQGLFVNHARAQQSWRCRGQFHDRGFYPNLGLAAVDDERNFISERFLDMRSVGWRKLARKIGAGCRERKAAFANDRLDERMARPTHTDSWTSG